MERDPPFGIVLKSLPRPVAFYGLPEAPIPSKIGGIFVVAFCGNARMRRVGLLGGANCPLTKRKVRQFVDALAGGGAVSGFEDAGAEERSALGIAHLGRGRPSGFVAPLDRPAVLGGRPLKMRGDRPTGEILDKKKLRGDRFVGSRVRDFVAAIGFTGNWVKAIGAGGREGIPAIKVEAKGVRGGDSHIDETVATGHLTDHMGIVAEHLDSRSGAGGKDLGSVEMWPRHGLKGGQPPTLSTSLTFTHRDAEEEAATLAFGIVLTTGTITLRFNFFFRFG